MNYIESPFFFKDHRSFVAPITVGDSLQRLYIRLESACNPIESNSQAGTIAAALGSVRAAACLGPTRQGRRGWKFDIPAIGS